MVRVQKISFDDKGDEGQNDQLNDNEYDKDKRIKDNPDNGDDMAAVPASSPSKPSDSKNNDFDTS